MAIRFLEVGLFTHTELDTPHSAIIEMEKLIPDSHDYLMDFMDFDLSKAEQLMADYLSCIKEDSVPNKDTLAAAIAELKAMHPYFSLCDHNARFLINRIFAGYIKRHFTDRDEFEQKNLFSSIQLSGFNEYTDPDEAFEMSLDSGHPFVLDELLSLQKFIRTWVTLTVDNTNPELALLNSQQRSALYAHVSGTDNVYTPTITIESSFSTKPSKKLEKRMLKWEFANLDSEKTPKKVLDDPDFLNADHYEKISKALDALRWDAESRLPQVLRTIVNAARDAGDCTELTYHIRDFRNLLELEVYQMVTTDTRIRRCKCCKRYFLPSRKSQEYCTRIAPGSTKTCAEVGPTRTYDSRMIGDKSTSQALYRNAYKTRHARVTRGSMTQADFDEWNREALDKREQVKEGTLDLFVYQEWLKL